MECPDFLWSAFPWDLILRSNFHFLCGCMAEAGLLFKALPVRVALSISIRKKAYYLHIMMMSLVTGLRRRLILKIRAFISAGAGIGIRLLQIIFLPIIVTRSSITRSEDIY